MIPIINEPFMFFATSTDVMINPITKVSKIMLKGAIPKTGVPFDTMNLASAKPIRVINKPIPAATAYLICLGIDFTISVRTLNTESRKKITPAQNTAPKAVSTGNFIPITTAKVKNAANPIPGATKIGLFAYKPIMMVQKALRVTVAVSTALKGRPVALSIAGLTTITYIAVTNVVIPAMISIRMLVLLAFSPKYLSIDSIIALVFKMSILQQQWG